MNARHEDTNAVRRTLRLQIRNSTNRQPGAWSLS